MNTPCVNFSVFRSYPDIFAQIVDRGRFILKQAMSASKTSSIYKLRNSTNGGMAPLKLYPPSKFQTRTASTVCIMNRYNINNTLGCAALDAGNGICEVLAKIHPHSPVRCKNRVLWPWQHPAETHLRFRTYWWTSIMAYKGASRSLFIIIKLLFGNLCTLRNYSANGKRRGSPRDMPQAAMYSAR